MARSGSRFDQDIKTPKPQKVDNKNLKRTRGRVTDHFEEETVPPLLPKTAREVEKRLKKAR